MLHTGQVCRIATGAPLPNGADAVVMVEVTELVESKHDEETVVRLLESCDKGDNIREIGSDIQKDELIFEAGHLVGPADVGLLASLGRSDVCAYSVVQGKNLLIQSHIGICI